MTVSVIASEAKRSRCRRHHGAQIGTEPVMAAILDHEPPSLGYLDDHECAASEPRCVVGATLLH